MLRESYENLEITEIIWIPGTENSADGFTKSGPCSAPETLLHKNKVQLKPNSWIDRTLKGNCNIGQHRRKVLHA